MTFVNEGYLVSFRHHPRIRIGEKKMQICFEIRLSTLENRNEDVGPRLATCLWRGRNEILSGN